MANVWTHGVWTVKPGREDEFVTAGASSFPPAFTLDEVYPGD